eukprot:2999294-Amphidinium_carterae.1
MPSTKRLVLQFTFKGMHEALRPQCKAIQCGCLWQLSFRNFGNYAPSGPTCDLATVASHLGLSFQEIATHLALPTQNNYAMILPEPNELFCPDVGHDRMRSV